MLTVKLAAPLLLLSIITGCGQPAGAAIPPSAPTASATPGAPSAANPSAGARRAWDAVHNWVYWLDGPDLAEIATTPFELAVIDYSADGTASGEFSATQIAALRQGGCDRRVLAYLSIGEAEKYRFYWQQGWRPGSPAWLLAENPDWEGNYLVRYWDPAWQQIIFSYLDRIIAQGFDGVYLDRVDAYTDAHAGGQEQAMVDFVLAISRYARAHSPLGEDFGIVVQNAEELAGRHPDYVAALTGIGREEVYVRASNQATTAAERGAAEAWLKVFQANSRGHLVLTVDYADQPNLVRDAYERAQRLGFVPYVTSVDLDSIRTNPGFTPVCRPPA